MSLTRRLIMIVGVLVGGLWLVTAAISRTVITHEVDEVYTENLSRTAVRFIPLIVHALSGVPDGDETLHAPRALQEDLRFFAAGQNGFLAYEVRDRHGVLVLQSYDAAALALPAHRRAGHFRDTHLITYTINDPASGLSLTLAEPAAHRNEAVNEAMWGVLTPMLVLLPLLVLAIWLVTRQALKPMADLREQIAVRGGSNFDPLDSDALPIELRPIAQSVDRLLDRVKDVIESEHAFASNSAHELRTPLAGALAQTQRLREDIGAGSGHERAAAVESTLRRLADFTEKLLQLSRVESNTGVQARENVTPVLDMIVQDFTTRSTHPAAISVEDNLKQNLLVAMDMDAFAIALRNLIENAVVHGDSDGRVRVVIENDWTVRVVNAGAVTPADELEHLRERFARGRTGAGGSGLGLAIVDRIMVNCGGALHLYSPATGAADGFEAVLKLP